ncbi:hypothetical protein JCM5353_008178 [Sporobolomyces roseus]
MTTELYPSTLPLLTILPLIVTLPSEQPQPHLSFLLSATLKLIYSNSQDQPQSWKECRARMMSQEAGLEEKLLDVLGQCRELLAGGSDAVSDWVHHDLRPLCSSVEEDEPSTIAQAPILRTSPLGIFLRKSALRIDKMGFEELAEWCKEVERWFNGGGRGAQVTSGKRMKTTSSTAPQRPPLSNPQLLLSTALSHFHQKNYDLLLLSLSECFKISRSLGDRKTLDGCWSLLKRIPKEYQTRFLNDTGTNDQDKSGGGGGKGKSRMIEEFSKSNPHDILYEIQSSLDRTESVNHSTISNHFLRLYIAQTLSTTSPPSTNPPPKPGQPNTTASTSKGGPKLEIDREEFRTSSEYVKSRLWDQLNIAPLSQVHQDLSILSSSSSTPSSSDLFPLRILISRAQTLSDQNHSSEALQLLLNAVGTKPGRDGLFRTSPEDARDAGWGEWKGCLWKVLERGLERKGDTEGTRAIRALLPRSKPTRNSRQSPASSLSSSLLDTSRSPNELESKLSLTLSRLSMNSCTSPDEAKKGLIDLEGVMNLVLLRSSSAQGEKGKSEEEGEQEMEDDESNSKEQGVERVRSGMNDDRELEARYWELRAKLKIVESDFNDTTIKDCLPLLEKSLRLYRSLSLHPQALSILTQLHSLFVHLALSEEISPGEAGEWRRRSEGYRVGLDEVREGKIRGDEKEGGWDWRKVVEMVRALEELI